MYNKQQLSMVVLGLEKRLYNVWLKVQTQWQMQQQICSVYKQD